MYNFKVFIFHKAYLNPKLKKLVEEIKTRSKEMIFETDDLIFDLSHLRQQEFYQHLGEADRFLVYALDEEKKSCSLVDSRPAPPPGGGKDRWEALAAKLADCRALLVNSAGDSPKNVLNARGIDVMAMEGVIEEAVYGIFTGQNVKHLMKNTLGHVCKSGCSGAGNGCD